MWRISTALFCAALVLQQVDGAEQKANEAEFREMCDFMAILKKNPGDEEKGDGREVMNSVHEVQQALERIKLYNLSTTDQDTFKLLESKAEWKDAETNTVVKVVGPEEWEASKKAWEARAEKAQEYNRPTDPLLTKLAHAKIGKILSKAQTLYEQFKQEKKAAEDKLRDARKAMFAAAYGAAVLKEATFTEGETNGQIDFNGVRAVAGSFPTGDTNGYEKGCTGSQGDKLMGMSIVNDIVCICAIKTSPNNENLCGASVTGLGTQGYSAGDKGLTLWGNIERHCTGAKREAGVEIVPDANVLRDIITRHKNLLGKGAYGGAAVTTGQGKAGSNHILGLHALASTTAPACTGAQPSTSGGAGICVNYGPLIEDGKPIPWVAQVEKAVNLLTARERVIRQMQSLAAKLETAADSAEHSYHDALHGKDNHHEGRGLEAVNSVSSANKQGSPGAQTAQEGLQSAATFQTSALRTTLVCIALS